MSARLQVPGSSYTPPPTPSCAAPTPARTPLLTYYLRPRNKPFPARIHSLTLNTALHALLQLVPHAQQAHGLPRSAPRPAPLCFSPHLVSRHHLRAATALFIAARPLFREWIVAALVVNLLRTMPEDHAYLTRRLALLRLERLRHPRVFDDLCNRMCGVIRHMALAGLLGEETQRRNKSAPRRREESNRTGVKAYTSKRTEDEPVGIQTPPPKLSPSRARQGMQGVLQVPAHRIRVPPVPEPPELVYASISGSSSSSTSSSLASTASSVSSTSSTPTNPTSTLPPPQAIPRTRAPPRQTRARSRARVPPRRARHAAIPAPPAGRAAGVLVGRDGTRAGGLCADLTFTRSTPQPITYYDGSKIRYSHINHPVAPETSITDAEVSAFIQTCYLQHL
ncbi:hypothetical protein C8J57DRAFT_1705152 [Mycena rebaudengoi]|nr:hypothetical protein C8J57DRAFT_1705152 [Mycena rebaudengoi]